MYEFPALYPVWSPAEISTALWLDAADASTVTTDSGAVSQWNDKSGNALTFTQTGSNRPAIGSNTLGGKNVLTFTAANSQCLVGADSLNSVWTGSGWHLFAIARATTMTIINSILTKIGDSTQSENQRQLSWAMRDLGGIKASQLFTSYSLIGTSFTVARSEAILDNTYYLLNVSYDNTAGTVGATANTTARVQHIVNGAQQSEVVTASGGNLGAIQNGTARLAIGASAGSTGTVYAIPFGGDIAEIIALPSVATADTRQRIEGYLAHKWGLEANLPNDHPYKTVGPTP
jgi:hypothetical protein